MTCSLIAIIKAKSIERSIDFNNTLWVSCVDMILITTFMCKLHVLSGMSSDSIIKCYSKWLFI